MKQFCLLLFLLSCYTLSAQNINGVIYNSSVTIEDIKIENLSNKSSVFTNKNGEFTIAAKVNDTLEVSSIFYTTQNIIVKSSYEKETFVIQLKKTKNTLDEVNITGTEKEKIADVKMVQASMRNQILEDIKRNPHLYGKSPSGNLDFIKIIGLIGKLFKNKNKAEPFRPITYQKADSLFTYANNLFNTTLLTETLKITEDKKYLFFEFVEAKNIDSNLLNVNKELELLEIILKVGEEFNTIIKNFKIKNSD